MSNINLKDFIKTDNIRRRIGQIEVYELSNEQKQEVVELLSNQELASEGINIGSKLTREFIRNNTNFGATVDEYTDEELSKIIDDNNELKLMLRELESMLDEVLDEVMHNQVRELKVINSMLNMLNRTKDTEDIQKKMNKLLKKHGIKDINELTKKNNKKK